MKFRLGHSAPATDLYVSDLAREARAYAELRPFDGWAVLSAENVLLTPNHVVAPYEATNGDPPTRPNLRWWAVLDDAVADVGPCRAYAGRRRSSARFALDRL